MIFDPSNNNKMTNAEYNQIFEKTEQLINDKNFHQVCYNFCKDELKMTNEQWNSLKVAIIAEMAITVPFEMYFKK